METPPWPSIPLVFGQLVPPGAKDKERREWSARDEWHPQYAALYGVQTENVLAQSLFANATLYPDRFPVAEHIPGRAAVPRYQYHLFQTRRAALEYIARVPPGARTFHTIVEPDRPVYFYADVDVPRACVGDEFDWPRAIETLVAWLECFFSATYCLDVGQWRAGRWHAYDSSSSAKFSCHLHARLAFANIAELRRVMAQFLDTLSDERACGNESVQCLFYPDAKTDGHVCILDPIYNANRNVRLPFQHKHASARTLQPWRTTEFDFAEHDQGDAAVRERVRHLRRACPQPVRCDKHPPLERPRNSTSASSSNSSTIRASAAAAASAASAAAAAAAAGGGAGALCLPPPLGDARGPWRAAFDACVRHDPGPTLGAPKHAFASSIWAGLVRIMLIERAICVDAVRAMNNNTAAADDADDDDKRVLQARIAARLEETASNAATAVRELLAQGSQASPLCLLLCALCGWPPPPPPPLSVGEGEGEREGEREGEGEGEGEGERKRAPHDPRAWGVSAVTAAGGGCLDAAAGAAIVQFALGTGRALVACAWLQRTRVAPAGRWAALHAFLDVRTAHKSAIATESDMSNTGAAIAEAWTRATQDAATGDRARCAPLAALNAALLRHGPLGPPAPAARAMFVALGS